MTCEIKRPGSDTWESGDDLGGAVPLGDVVGSLVRYHTGNCPIVLKVVGLSDPDDKGNRNMLMEVHGGE